MDILPCSIYGCNEPRAWRSLCAPHRSALPTACAVDGCVKPYKGRGLCAMHGYRMRKHGDPLVTLRVFDFELVHGTPKGYKHHKCRCELCREARRLAELAWRAEHPEVARAASRRAREADPDRMREYRAKWKRRNPEKVRGYSALRAANPFDEAAVEYAALIIHDPCVFCGGKSSQIDHIDPLMNGGTSDWSNLAPTCASCNGTKGGKSLLDFLLYRAA